VQWDVHAHELKDRAQVASLLTQLGGHPTAVISGMTIDETEAMRLPLTASDGFVWQGEVIWGGNFAPSHGPAADNTAIGIWRPASSADYFTHDPNGSLITVGGGDHTLTSADQLIGEVMAGQLAAPVTAFTIMVRPSTLMIVDTDDGLDAIAAWADRAGALPVVRWATIAETASAWVAAGEIPSLDPIP
jgi:hypothetical protein